MLYCAKGEVPEDMALVVKSARAVSEIIQCGKVRNNLSTAC